LISLVSSARARSRAVRGAFGVLIVIPLAKASDQ
jgi:hypothetical protein